MKRIVLLFSLLLLLVASVFANSNGDAHTKTVLYIYTPSCGYCVKFNPIYEKVSKLYKDKCNFKKVNAHSVEGQKLMIKYNGVFVPYVLILDEKNNYKAFLAPNCLLDYSCVNSAVENFVKK